MCLERAKLCIYRCPNECLSYLFASIPLLNYIGSVWYMCLKIKNYYLKIFVEIRVGEKVYRNA